MKEFKDYTIADFTERVKMQETNLARKRVVAPIAYGNIQRSSIIQ